MRIQVLAPTPENIALAASALQAGQVLGMPTETVYGLAGDCRNTQALTRIFQTKERPTFDPLIVHVGISAGSVEKLGELDLIDLSQITPLMKTRINLLMQKFWPGPLTLILPKSTSVPDLVTSGLPTVAIRMPSHPVAQALIQASGKSLAAPSANRFGRISPTTAQAVAEELGDRIDYVLEGGPCQIGVESTVVRIDSEGQCWILRHGGAPKEKIEETLQLTAKHVQSSQAHFASPGMLASHYAPKKPLFLLPKSVQNLQEIDLNQIRGILEKFPNASLIGLLVLSGDAHSNGNKLSSLIGKPVIAQTLSQTGSLEEAAHHLFSEMRLLDASAAAFILSEPCPSPQGLGFAIADRLKRASTTIESFNSESCGKH